MEGTIGTVPLLSPTMETELLMENWPLASMELKTTTEPENYLIWEENFQDLSTWCMDSFREQCDFHIGESPVSNMSDEKPESNDVSTIKVGEPESWVFGERRNFGTCISKAFKLLDAGCSMQHQQHLQQQQSPSSPIMQPIKVEENCDTEAKVPNDRSYVIRTNTLSVNEDENTWALLNDAEVTTQLDTDATTQLEITEEKFDLKDVCPSFDSIESQQQDTWDILPPLDTTGSDNFDLLSYLCKDEAGSLDRSTTAETSLTPTPSTTTLSMHSTDSITTTKGTNKSETTSYQRWRTDTTPPSTITSSTLSTSPTTRRPITKSTGSSRKTERTMQLIAKIDTVVAKNNHDKQQRKGRKRCIDSDSDDRNSDSSYRETREKNNEASRKSRMNKKAKENEMALRAVELEKDNKILKMKVEELEKLVTAMRSALLRSALKKEF